MAPDFDELEQRSDNLQEGIDDARRQAQQDGLLPDPNHHERSLADPDGNGEPEGMGPATG